MKKLFITLFSLVAFATSAFSQSEYKPIDFTLQLKNMHLWRGYTVTNTPMTAVDLHYNSKNNHFSAGVWGGAGFTGDYKEFDYYLSYQNKGFNIAVWDIYNFSNGATYNNSEFFNYKAGETGHFIDLTVGYKLQGSFPLSMSWSTILYGRDRGSLNEQNLYSTFVQLGYPVLKSDLVNIDVFAAGAFALNPEEGSTANFYGSKSNLVSLGFTASKTLKIGDFSLPVSVMPMWNPELNQANIQFAVNLF
ncbi:hypothetical protein D3C78_1003160 [compost metagenome]